MGLYDKIVDKNMTVRRVTITACNLMFEKDCTDTPVYEQMDLFTDYEEVSRQRKIQNKMLQKERKIQEAVIGIKHRYGKNAIVRGANLQEGATSIERNQQIGGHKA